MATEPPPTQSPGPAGTYSSTQWAAVTIQSGVMMDPPQTWVPWTCRLTCQGQSPSAAFVPPTMRLWRLRPILVRTPHSAGEEHSAVRATLPLPDTCPHCACPDSSRPTGPAGLADNCRHLSRLRAWGVTLRAYILVSFWLGG